jgi:hypothetical protein
VFKNRNHESLRGFCFLILLQGKQDNGINIDSPLLTSATFSIQICGKKGNKKLRIAPWFLFLLLLQEKQDNGIITDSPLFTSATFSPNICGKKGNKKPRISPWFLFFDPASGEAG